MWWPGVVHRDRALQAPTPAARRTPPCAEECLWEAYHTIQMKVRCQVCLAQRQGPGWAASAPGTKSAGLLHCTCPSRPWFPLPPVRLKRYFQRYGEVSDAIIMRNAEDGRHRGFGCVQQRCLALCARCNAPCLPPQVRAVCQQALRFTRTGREEHSFRWKRSRDQASNSARV